MVFGGYSLQPGILPVTLSGIHLSQDTSARPSHSHSHHLGSGLHPILSRYPPLCGRLCQATLHLQKMHISSCFGNQKKSEKDFRFDERRQKETGALSIHFTAS